MMGLRVLSVVVAVSGCTGALMGAPGDELFKVTAADGTLNDRLGQGIAINGGVAVVGARLDDLNGTDSGTAYLVSVATGLIIDELNPTDVSGGDNFGVAAAIDSQHVLVGAPNCDEVANNAGCAFLFDRDSGLQTFRLLANDGESGDTFGSAVAVHGGFAAVGVQGDDDNGPQSGSAYVFSTGSGGQVWKLLPSDGGAFKLFGFAVGVNDSVAVVSSRNDNVNGTNSGSVYLFDLATGLEVSKIVASDGAMGAQFGRSVAVFGDVLVVGAIADGEAGSGAGAAYVFDISDPAAPVEESKLIAGDAQSGDEFGVSVAVGDNGQGGVLAAVGAWRDDDVGSAYVFDVSDLGNPVEIVKVQASDASQNSDFGVGVGVSDGVLIVGSPEDDEEGSNAGAAYLFDAGSGGVGCSVDLNGDGVLDFFDISAFLSAFGAGEAVADFNGDGVFDFFDISEFLMQFAAGCG